MASITVGEDDIVGFQTPVTEPQRACWQSRNADLENWACERVDFGSLFLVTGTRGALSLKICSLLSGGNKGSIDEGGSSSGRLSAKGKVPCGEAREGEFIQSPV